MNTETGTVDIENGFLYFETAGEGETLVFSHAAFVDSRMFDAQWQALAQHFRVIRYDMRGFGRSSAVAGPICRREDLRLLLDHLNVDQAHFVGCSNGGTLMLDYTLEHPERVLSLTMVGSTPSGFELQGEPPRYMMEMFGAAQAGDVDRANELQIRIWFDGEHREPETVDSALRAQVLMMNRIPVEQSTFLIADVQPANPLDPAAFLRLGEVQCPVLVMCGALDHAEVLRAVDVMVDGIPNAQKYLIEDAAHIASFEKPEQFNKRLLDFLQAV